MLYCKSKGMMRMFQIVINTLLSTLTGAIIGYCAKIVKDHREKTRKEKDDIRK